MMKAASPQPRARGSPHRFRSRFAHGSEETHRRSMRRAHRRTGTRKRASLPSTFESLGVAADLVAALERDGITDPFPIQALTIPDALAGRDVLGKAKTGSGKTLAFGLPLLARVAKAAPRSPRGLVLVPTRELATQVTTVLKPLAEVRERRVRAVYGG